MENGRITRKSPFLSLSLSCSVCCWNNYKYGMNRIAYSHKKKMRCALERSSFCSENEHKNKCPCRHSMLMPEIKNYNDSEFVIPILNHKKITHDASFASTPKISNANDGSYFFDVVAVSHREECDLFLRSHRTKCSFDWDKIRWFIQIMNILTIETFISNAPVHFHIEYRSDRTIRAIPMHTRKYRHLYLLAIKEPKQNEEPCYDVISIF